ncbi:lysozyme inhibitor LprI family protein [uncultured Shewanella sp.]|uniref:lysozyme inhibitor LprI family protein n=1 Tax=uncultured Shewanella sp. TaxID=173975 RepID=UPI002608D198|nr:lysozyme inhibitor LprI family protein [uncultured Shewanella sp.]
MRNIVILITFLSFQSMADVNDEDCFNKQYLPEINNCFNNKLSINRVNLEKEYKKLETYLSNSQDHKKYLEDIIKNKQEWEKVTNDFCKLESYFVEEKTITHKIQFNQCMVRKIKHQILEVTNLYEIISSMM